MAPVSEQVRPGLTVEAFGVRVAVQVDDPGLIEVLRARLGVASMPFVDGGSEVQLALSSADGFHYELLSDDVPVAHSVELEVAMAMLEAGLYSEMAQRAQGILFIQGGAVAVAGRALVLLGPRFSGTSTLIRELISRGATPISDHYALLDEDGRVHPFPGSPSASAAEPEPLPIGLLAATTFIPGAVWAPRELGAADTALLLLSHAVTLRDDPARTMEAVRSAVAGVRALESERGEAAEVAALLLDLMAG